MRSLFCRNIQLKAELRLNRETLSLPVVLSPLAVQFGWRPKEKIMDESSSNLFLLQNFWAYPSERLKIIRKNVNVGSIFKLCSEV